MLSNKTLSSAVLPSYSLLPFDTNQKTKSFAAFYHLATSANLAALEPTEMRRRQCGEAWSGDTHMYSVTGALLTVCAAAGMLVSLP